MDTLVIGDVHGHYDRMLALLQQEGIVDENENRINHDVRVIQLGDLGHFGKTGSHTGDYLLYEKAEEWFDTLLYGNHDLAVVDPRCSFNGYDPGDFKAAKIMKELSEKHFIKLCASAHGFLITHAGLHPNYEFNIKGGIGNFVEMVNLYPPNNLVFDVSRERGGWDNSGGILWRHITEKLADVPQIFGHSVGDKLKKFPVKGMPNKWSYCIDVGTQNNGRLMGMWLPEEKVVEVKV
jgi:hypothetical protein